MHPSSHMPAPPPTNKNDDSHAESGFKAHSGCRQLRLLEMGPYLQGCFKVVPGEHTDLESTRKWRSFDNHITVSLVVAGTDPW